MKPTFIGIGAQKCASTWLHRVLREHPQVGLPEEKEIDFFSYRFDHGYQWYEERFRGCEGKVAVGEISPSYFCEPAVPERLHRYLPSARIVVSLRDPVTRALSNHRHEVRLGRTGLADHSFEAGLANNPMYIEQGRYATHMQRWLRFFPPEQILVLFMEDIEQDPGAVAQTVYDFLGVEWAPESALLSERVNGSYATRYRLLARVKDLAYEGTNKGGLRWLWGLGGTIGARALYRRINVLPSSEVIPPAREETLARLREVFAPEVRELSRITGRPLDSWLE